MLIFRKHSRSRFSSSNNSFGVTLRHIGYLSYLTTVYILHGTMLRKLEKVNDCLA